MFSADAPVFPNTVVRNVPMGGIQVREDVLFGDAKGVEKSGVRKTKTKLLEALRPALEKALQPKETILLLCPAQSPLTVLEQLTASAFTYYYTRSVLVVTNSRLLHIPVNTQMKWRRSLRAVLWGDVEQATAKGWLITALNLKYRSGKKERYGNLQRQDAKKLRLLLPLLLDPASAERSALGTIHSVCPECLSPLTEGVYRCDHCALVFKDEATMLKRSLIVPAGAYFYTGHPLMGALFALIEAILILDVVIGVTTHQWDLVIGALIGLALEKAVTIFHARRFVREFMPIGSGAAVQSAHMSAGGRP